MTDQDKSTPTNTSENTINHQPPTTEWKTQVVPCNFLWMLAEFGNIAPGLAECQGAKDGFHVTWYIERDWLPRGKWDEVCFLCYREGKIRAGFNGKFLSKYYTEYHAILGMAESNDAEWIDYDDPKGGK